MQPIDIERMRKWRDNILPVKSAAIFPGRLESGSKPVPLGCGGDLKDNRDQDAWNYEFRNNPIYRGYR